MAKFRKKPVVIDAWPVSDLLYSAKHNWSSLPETVREAYESGGWVFAADGIYLPTLEGSLKASKKDMLIRGVKGEFYPCKFEIFEQTYEDA